MQFSKKSQYGLRAMVYLAKHFKKEKVLSLKTIAKDEGIPFDFLEKIILELEKANLVKAKKGVQGGYFLAKSPKKIKAVDIIKILETNIKPVQCQECERIRRCVTKNVWKKVHSALISTLNSITLEQLVNPVRKGGAF